MRLKKAQKEYLLELIGENLEIGEINERCALFQPPFEVKKTLLDYYRRTRGQAFLEEKKKSEKSALATGFAVREARVAKLNQLAELLLDDLLNKKLWLRDKKSIGSGPGAEIFNFKRFNEPGMRQFRGLLDDIAREMGERATNVNLGGQQFNPLEIVQTQILKLYGSDATDAGDDSTVPEISDAGD